MRAVARVALRGNGVALSGPWVSTGSLRGVAVRPGERPARCAGPEEPRHRRARARDSVVDDWMERQRNPIAPQRNAQESMSSLSSKGPIFVFTMRPSAETSTE